MRYSFLVSVAFAALVAVAPASFAFEVQHAQTNPDGSVKFTDPDNLTNSMSSNLAGQSNSSAIHFGGTTLQFSGGNGGSNSSYGMSPAYRQQFMGGPDQIGNAISPR